MDDEIDKLYQLPLDRFTPARNALAKHAGARASEIKGLEKPNLAAWAVNQLFWRKRPVYDELIEASQQLRVAYRDQLAGKSPDVRGAEANHRAAVKRATQVAREIVEAGGSKASDAVIGTVRETLDMLPSHDAPGRLTKPLERTGFEALEGVTFSVKPRPAPPKIEPQATTGKPQTIEAEKRANQAAERERNMTRERLRFAEAAEREALATLDRARRAVERAERVRQRVERELDEAATVEKGLRNDEVAAQAACDQAAAEKASLAAKLG